MILRLFAFFTVFFLVVAAIVYSIILEGFIVTLIVIVLCGAAMSSLTYALFGGEGY